MVQNLPTLGAGLFMLLCGGMGIISSFNSLRLLLFAPEFHPARPGRMIARGVVRATDPVQVQTAPLSQTRCIAYELVITENRGRNAKAYLYTERRGQWNLSLQTAKGDIVVQSCQLDLNIVHAQELQDLFQDGLSERSHQLLAQNKIPLKNLAGMRRSLTLTECVLCEGSQVYLVGRQYWANQQRHLKDAIMTDKPISQLILKATVIFVASSVVFWFSTAVLQAAFR